MEKHGAEDVHNHLRCSGANVTAEDQWKGYCNQDGAENVPGLFLRVFVHHDTQKGGDNGVGQLT